MKNNKRYLVACSGGPDSMTLLAMYYKKGYYLEVGHVNYHKRKTADRDENIVRDYCDKHNIKFNVLDVYPDEVEGNFQNYARKIRYEFFAKLCLEHNLQTVLVAHQQDDYIETYLMQKAKKLGVKEYGLAKSNNIYGANVYRPLLNYRKKDLLNYCKRNKIEFGIDESNLTDDYTRNKVRHSKVEKLSDAQREEIIIEILRKNVELFTIESEALKFICGKHKFEIDEFINFKYLKSAIRNIFDVPMSDKYLDEIIRQLKESDSFKLLRNNIYLLKEYDYIEYFEYKGNYAYKVKKDELFATDYFKLRKTGTDNMSCVTVKDSDYPLTIRSYKEGDYIEMLYGKKKINRFFIDNKISLKDRLTWPIVTNKYGSVILVPKIGCDKHHYSNKPNLYVLK